MRFLLVALLSLLPIQAASVTLVEPSTKADGSPLTYLRSCAYEVSTPGQVGGSVTLPASRPEGGGSHPVVTNLEGPVTVRARCVREVAGAVGPPSADAVLSARLPVLPPAQPRLECEVAPGGQSATCTIVEE